MTANEDLKECLQDLQFFIIIIFCVSYVEANFSFCKKGQEWWFETTDGWGDFTH